jgi:transcriptional regulator
VPTWNYVAVHAIGAVEVFEDATRLHALVDRLTNHHEAPRAEPWAVDDEPGDFIASQLKGIVGLRMEIATLIGKRKLSQNRPEQDRHGVVEGLAGSGDARDRDVAALMQRG